MLYLKERVLRAFPISKIRFRQGEQARCLHLYTSQLEIATLTKTLSCSFRGEIHPHRVRFHGAAYRYPTQAPDTPRPRPPRRAPPPRPGTHHMPPHTLAPLAPFWASPRHAVCTCLNRLGHYTATLHPAHTPCPHTRLARCPSARCVRRRHLAAFAPFPRTQLSPLPLAPRRISQICTTCQQHSFLRAVLAELGKIRR